jgi:hypothetical protein
VNTVDPAGLRQVAAECVALVATEHGIRLDWSVDSLAELDDVCAALLADGPLGAERFELWWKLIGAYTGEVLLRTYGGSWTRTDGVPGSLAVSVIGIRALPFGIAARVLRGEPHKSLASFARGVPAVAGGEEESPRLPVDPARQPAIDELILAGRYADAIAAAREAYGLTMNDAFHGVLARKRELVA